MKAGSKVLSFSLKEHCPNTNRYTNSVTENKPKFDLQTLARVLSLAKPHARIFIVSGALAIILALLSAITPKIVNIMVDDYVMVKDMPGLYRMAGIFVGVVLVTVVFRYLFIYITGLLGQSVIKDLRVQTFQHITSLKMRYFDQTPIGKTTTRTINDIESINTIFTQGVITMIADVLGIFAILGFMLQSSWRLTLVCLTTLPLLILATYIFKEKVKKAYQKVRAHITSMNVFLQERISGMRVVQIFNAEEREMGKFKKINRDYTQANLDSILYYAIFFPVIEIIQYGTLAIMVWWGAKWFVEDSLTIGVLVAFPMYINRLYRPIRMLADKLNTIQMGLVAAVRVFNVLDDRSIIADIGYQRLEKSNGVIEFKNVSFAYDEENYVLKDISFQLNQHETLAIVGSTGSGKTTIINILNRFYDIQKGEILLDGVDVKKYVIDDLRKRISIVLQDVFLFTGTVLENITLKDPSISKDKVVEAATAIGAHDFIMNMPGGYDYIVSERGGNLSMGQRQLISFVRALVFDPDVLILDEATSSIDKETEGLIQYAIEKLIAKRSSIIIAHRLSTIRHADKIMVLDKGRLIEFGSHDELLAIEGGKFKELYELQFADLEFAE